MRSKLADIPARPSMPINGMSRERWADYYRRELSDHLRNQLGHYPDDLEWLQNVDLQFDLQRLMDAEMLRETEV